MIEMLIKLDESMDFRGIELKSTATRPFLLNSNVIDGYCLCEKQPGSQVFYYEMENGRIKGTFYNWDIGVWHGVLDTYDKVTHTVDFSKGVEFGYHHYAFVAPPELDFEAVEVYNIYILENNMVVQCEHVGIAPEWNPGDFYEVDFPNGLGYSIIVVVVTASITREDEEYQILKLRLPYPHEIAEHLD